MDSTKGDSDASVPEMSRSLKQIIDNNFEEAEFDKGIAMLEQLRSCHHVPSIAHILHLIYIALHPVKDIQLNATGLEEEEIYDPKILVMSSPRKLVKQTKSRRVLSAVAVVAAQKLLSAFVRTNPPVSLAAALPFYPDVTLDTPFELELVDSVIFLQVKALRDNSKSCWDLVKTGALEQAKRAYPTSVKTKGRAQPSRGTHDYSTVDGAESEEVKPVGDNSWFLLGWLLDLFEKDSDERALKSQPRHSPLLLKQIPRAPHGSNTRWDCSEPLKVILYAFQQTQSRRQAMGRRLLMLLIELTQLSPTPLLSMQGLLTSIITRFSTCSSSNTPSTSVLRKIMSQLPCVPSVLAFRLALCKRILQDALVTTSSRPSAVRPGPKPRALTRKSTTSTILTEGDSKPESASTTTVNLSQAIPQMPPYDEVVKLALTQIPTRVKKSDGVLASADFLLGMKFEMLLACATLRRLLNSSGIVVQPEAQGDVHNEKEWVEALQNQGILGVLDTAFGGPLPVNVDEAERSIYVSTLKSFFAGLT